MIMFIFLLAFLSYECDSANDNKCVCDAENNCGCDTGYIEKDGVCVIDCQTIETKTETCCEGADNKCAKCNKDAITNCEESETGYKTVEGICVIDCQTIADKAGTCCSDTNLHCATCASDKQAACGTCLNDGDNEYTYDENTKKCVLKANNLICADLAADKKAGACYEVADNKCTKCNKDTVTNCDKCETGYKAVEGVCVINCQTIADKTGTCCDGADNKCTRCNIEEFRLRLIVNAVAFLL